MSHGHYHTSAAWAPPQYPRRPAVERPWRFVVLIGTLAIGVSDEGVVVVRIGNDLVARIGGRQLPARLRSASAGRAAQAARRAARWGIEP